MSCPQDILKVAYRALKFSYGHMQLLNNQKKIDSDHLRYKSLRDPQNFGCFPLNYQKQESPFNEFLLFLSNLKSYPQAILKVRHIRSLHYLS